MSADDTLLNLEVPEALAQHPELDSEAQLLHGNKGFLKLSFRAGAANLDKV